MGKNYKKADGLYHIKGKTYKKLKGTRREVGNETAYKTSGGLTLNDLIFVNGRWKSAIKHKTAKKEKRLEKAGYRTKKGKFGSFRVKSTDNKTRKRKTRKSRK